MQKKFKSLNLAVVAASLVSLLSVSAVAETQLPIQKELRTYNVSADLVMLAMMAQNNGWKVVPSKDTNSIEIQKSLTYSRMLTGVHSRWKRVSETVDVSATATLSGDTITITSNTEIENERHIAQLDDEIEQLKQVWKNNALSVGAN